MTKTIERLAFKTSRLSEYFSEKELRQQIGFDVPHWKMALLKELIDNSLDACEAGDVPPCISITEDENGFAVSDNGPGISPEVVASILDYSTRTSTNAKYVSPTRGQLGNALKTVLAAPCVLFPDEDAGITIEARNKRHTIKIVHDAIAGEPRIHHQVEDAVVKNGTTIKVNWRDEAGYDDDEKGGEFYNPSGLLIRNSCDLVQSFKLFNPAAEFELDSEFDSYYSQGPTLVARRWLACHPTSPHWYSIEQLRDLVAAHLNRERQGLCELRTVREFVTTFAGLSGSAKAAAVLEQAKMKGFKLADLVEGDEIDGEALSRLHQAMRTISKPIKPNALGCIGRGNLLNGIFPDDGEAIEWKYRIVRGQNPSYGLPHVVEAGFVVYKGDHRTLRIGINWTPCLKVPFSGFNSLLSESFIDDESNVGLAVHIITPHAPYLDRGKSNIDFCFGINSDLRKAIKYVTKDWVRMRRKNRRDQARLSAWQEQQLENVQKKEKSIRDIAFEVMEDAHRHVVGGDIGAPAQARQLMYAARKRILAITGGKCWSNSATFTQQILPDYLERNPQTTAKWNVVYDARGRLAEPHSGKVVELGTVLVRNYVNSWHESIDLDPVICDGRSTPMDLASFVEITNNGTGPGLRYGFVLLIEKEGFSDLLNHAHIARRFDVAIATTKGVSTTASRELVDRLSAKGVTVAVLHDFDKAGFTILNSLREDSRRYRFTTRPKVIDLGLRLEDARQMELEGEPVEYKTRKDPSKYLQSVGATKEEIAFLVEQKVSSSTWKGRRVELNELSNQQLIALIERKLTEAGVRKIVPDENTLSRLYVQAMQKAWINQRLDAAKLKAFETAKKELGDLRFDPPANLVDAVQSQLVDEPRMPWHEALATVARNQARLAKGGAK